jgi:hypothetical protein
MLIDDGDQVPETGIVLSDNVFRFGGVEPWQIIVTPVDGRLLNAIVCLFTMVTFSVKVLAHCPGSGVKVYVWPVVVLTVDGLQLPE